MRQKTKILFLALTILVPSLAFAAGDDKDHGTRGGNGDKENNWRQRQQSKLLQQIAAKKKAQQAKKAFNNAYNALSEADKTKYQETLKIVQEGEWGAKTVDKMELVKFVSFISGNPTATCAVEKNPTPAAAQPKAKPRRVSYMQGNGGNGPGGMGSGVVKQVQAPAPAPQPEMGLMCSANNTKKFFTGLPTTALNSKYDANVQLASEGSGGATPTPTVENTAAATGYASTSFNAYLSQSMSDAAGKTPENTVFEDQSTATTDQASTERAPASTDSEMHFSTSAASQ